MVEVQTEVGSEPPDSGKAMPRRLTEAAVGATASGKLADAAGCAALISNLPSSAATDVTCDIWSSVVDEGRTSIKLARPAA